MFYDEKKMEELIQKLDENENTIDCLAISQIEFLIDYLKDEISKKENA